MYSFLWSWRLLLIIAKDDVACSYEGDVCRTVFSWTMKTTTSFQSCLLSATFLAGCFLDICNNTQQALWGFLLYLLFVYVKVSTLVLHRQTWPLKASTLKVKGGEGTLLISPFAATTSLLQFLLSFAPLIPSQILPATPG